jgi:replication-associated recombination protein RarA
MTLIEKYYPKTFDDLILPKSVKDSLLTIQKQDGYRLLLYSSPGTGKTTTCRLLSANNKTLYLSGSNDFNIETLRNKVMPFASGATIMSIKKSVIIDEAENIRDNIQDAFKMILDQCKSVNFLFATNEVEKINPAIRSRCTNFDYNFVNTNLNEHKKNYAQWVITIIKQLCLDYSITFEPDAIKLLVKNNFPDFRHILITLQQIIDSNLHITTDAVSSCAENSKQLIELYQLIENIGISPDKLYSDMVKYKGSEREAIMALGEPFFKYLNDKGLFDKTLDAAAIVSKYCDSYLSSINKFVTFMSLVLELRTLFR